MYSIFYSGDDTFKIQILFQSPQGNLYHHPVMHGGQPQTDYSLVICHILLHNSKCIGIPPI